MIRGLTRLLGCVTAGLSLASVAFAQTAGAAKDEFVPIDQLPPQEQLPAAPLLIAAYVVVLVVLFVYVFSVARRLSSVQQQVQRLEGDIKKGDRR